MFPRLYILISPHLSPKMGKVGGNFQWLHTVFNSFHENDTWAQMKDYRHWLEIAT